jgi:hypothetical protein
MSCRYPYPARPKRREGFHEIRGPSFLLISVEQGEKMEREALSLNVSGHPLSPYREALRRLGVFVLDQQRLRACSRWWGGCAALLRAQ